MGVTNGFFRGYVPTKNKKCMMKFKGVPDSELLSYDQVKNLPEYAGILAENAVLIDIDDAGQAEIMMNIVEDKDLLCRVYETTKGKHFLFLNENMFERCRTKVKLACGVTADIKIGAANSYEVLKYAKKERKIIYDILDDEDYGSAPKYFLPVSSRTDFLTLKAGDGRNQELFNYILTLQSEDFSKEEAREAIRVLNGYVMPEPLDSEEIEVILRDDAFQKPMFFNGKTFLHDKFARYLKSNYNISTINGVLHIYKDGIYRDGMKEIEAQMIKYIPSLNRAKRSEVLSYLELLTTDELEAAPANYVAFKNGIYNIETGDLQGFTPDIVITNKIEYDFIPNAYNQLCDDTLDKISCRDKQIRALLEEAVGYCFYRRNELRKCFILTGEKQNGKSTYLEMLNKLLGRDNVVNLDLKELGERFKTAQLAGKLANIGDDIGDEFIPNTAIFKKLVSGNPINVERKGMDPFDFSNYAKLMFSANNIPRFGKGRDSAAIMSRLIIIPFNAKFSPDDPDYDPYIKYKLIQPESIEYLISIGMQGLKRILENRSFTVSDKVTEQMSEYEENNNPVLLFFKEEPKLENEPVNKGFQQYCVFCNVNGFTPMSNIEFSKQVKKHYKLKTVQKKIRGKNVRIYVKGE